MKNDIFLKLEALPFFTLEALKSQLGKNPLPTIKYNLRIGKFIKLKRGVYVTQEFVKKVKYQGKFEDYLEFLATKLISPSYLSLEYHLFKSGVLSESCFSLTLITTKTPRVIKNNLGTFAYYNIKEGLFSGFNIKIRGEFEIKCATLAKAIFDYLYLKKRTLRVINKEVIGELRLNLDEVKFSDWQEFKKYLSLAKSKKLETIFKFLK